VIDKIVEASELTQAILPAEFIEARDTVFAVTNDIQGVHVNLSGLGFQARESQVLQEDR
jgi:hypothetical protein